MTDEELDAIATRPLMGNERVVLNVEERDAIVAEVRRLNEEVSGLHVRLGVYEGVDDALDGDG